MKTCLSLIGLFALATLLAPAVSAAEPAPEQPNRVLPGEYRIRVDLDELTEKRVRRDIDKTVREALDDLKRRFDASQELADEQLEEELKRYEDELKAIRKADFEARSARERGDIAEAQRWDLIRIRRTYDALNLARQTRAAGKALLAQTLENWHRSREQERILAEKLLRHLEAGMERIDAQRIADEAERGTTIPPPHR